MKHQFFSQVENRMAILGFVFVIPALIPVSDAILLIGFGITHLNDVLDAGLASPQFRGVLNTVIHPVTVLGGALFAFGLNLVPVTRIRLQFQQGSLISTVTVKGGLLNLGLTALSLLLLVTLLSYAFVENFQIIPR